MGDIKKVVDKNGLELVLRNINDKIKSLDEKIPTALTESDIINIINSVGS